MSAVVFIPLTRGKVAIIDFDDFEKVRSHKWQAVTSKNGRWYAACAINGRHTKMHRFLLGTPPQLKVDHKNGDGLDNQRNNLRDCSNANNCRAFRRKWAGSTSSFRGVSRHKASSSWVAQLCKNGLVFHLGCFQNEEDAARAYDKKAREVFGEYASPNFP